MFFVMWKLLPEIALPIASLCAIAVVIYVQTRYVWKELDLSSEEFKRRPWHIRILGKAIGFFVAILGWIGSP